MNSIKKLAGQTVIYGLGTIAPRILNYLLLTPFYTAIFETHEYGVVTELLAYVAMLMVVLTFGMETTYFRFASTEKNHDKVYSTAALFLLLNSVFFVFLVQIFTGDIAGLIKYNGHPEYIIWLAIVLGIDAFISIPFARLRQENRAIRFTIIKVINIFVNISLNLIFFVYLPDLSESNPDSSLLVFYNPEIGVGYAFISFLFTSIVTGLILIPDILKIKFIFDFSLFKRMLKYAYPLVIIGIAGMINEVSDKIFIKFLLSVPEHIVDKGEYIQGVIGIYGANTKLAVLMTMFIMMFKFAAEPFFFSQAKEKDSEITYAQVMKYFIIFCLFIFLGVILFIDLVKFFIDSKYHEGLFVVPIILLGNMFLGIFYNLSVWYKLSNLTKYGAVIAIIGATVTIIINVIFVPEYSYTASAWGHFTCYLVMMIISYFWGRKYMKVPYKILEIGKYFVAAAFVYVLNLIIQIEDIYINLGVNALIFMAFVLFVYLFEKNKIKTIMA